MSKIIYDPIHKYMTFDSIILKIIDYALYIYLYRK